MPALHCWCSRRPARRLDWTAQYPRLWATAPDGAHHLMRATFTTTPPCASSQQVSYIFLPRYSPCLPQQPYLLRVCTRSIASNPPRSTVNSAIMSGWGNDQQGGGYGGQQGDGYGNQQDGGYGGGQGGGFDNQQGGGYGGQQDSGYGNQQGGDNYGGQQGNYGNS